MRKLSLLFSAALLITLSHAQTAPRTSQNPANSRLEGAVDSYLQPYVAGKNFLGAVLIARRGEVLLRKGYGMANYELGVANTPQTRFHIASVSKPFTSAAILLLQERGLLKTSDTLTKFIPDYPSGDKITLRHLLTHTSGVANINDFPDYDEFAKTRHTVAELITKFKDKPLDFQPGAKYRYSNSNYNLLAFVIEKVAGQDYGEFLKKSIFIPLGMESTGHDGNAATLIPNRASGYQPLGFSDLEHAAFLDWSNKSGNGSLYSTLDDLYKFDRALYSDKLLNRASREEMFAPGKGISYGWSTDQQDGHKLIGINGRSPGFNASLLRFVDDDVCIIVLSNSYSSLSQTVIAPDLARIVFGQPPSSPFNPKPLAQAKFADYIGRYKFGPDYYRPNSTVSIERDGDNAVMRWESGLTSALIPAADNEFIDRAFWGRVTFDAGQGKAQRLTYKIAGNDFVANRKDE